MSMVRFGVVNMYTMSISKRCANSINEDINVKALYNSHHELSWLIDLVHISSLENSHHILNKLPINGNYHNSKLVISEPKNLSRK